MKAHQLLGALLLCNVVSTSFGMKQYEFESIEPLQHLSTFDGYKFDYTLGPDGFYSFYYLIPTSSRKEQRTASGEVTGEYAFVAPEGDEFEFRYNAGDEGYRVESNALPVPPEDTDEVKKAKEEFFAAYQKALEMAGSEESDEEDSSEENDYTSDSSEEKGNEGSEEDSSEESTEEGSEEKSNEGEEEEEQEEEEEKEEEEEEKESGDEKEGNKVLTRPHVGYRRPIPPGGYGEKLQKPIPYYYSR